ncbi:P-loop containing nucleoside triphosphate hydrolase protein, partial [Polyplosphaeria fusca]
NLKPEEAKAQASKLTYKEVDEVWDEKADKYKIAEPVTTKEVNELEQYVFVVRVRVDKTTKDTTSFIDIKSESLRDILRKILEDVRGVSRAEDMPTVEPILLFNFLPELESYRANAGNNSHNAMHIKHLELLVDFIKTCQRSTVERFASLLPKKEITYELLPALFKTNTEVYTTCRGTGEPRCFKCNYGEERTELNGSKFFYIEGRYINFDGRMFGEAKMKCSIPKFRGTRRIDSLEAYPLRFYTQLEEIRMELIKRGRVFCSLRGVHHRQYDGRAFHVKEKGEVASQHVKSRIMVDANFFQRRNPDYPAPRVYKSDLCAIDMSSFGKPDRNDSRVKYIDMDLDRMKDHELLVYSPTVLGFSLNDKSFLEFAVANISDIKWNPSSYDRLQIPDAKKHAVRALTETYLHRRPDYTYDFVDGKGQGGVLLLHGPLGVGKTLTAEVISECLKRPLYVLPAGQLGIDPVEIEAVLSVTFEISSHWKAILLLDEADVFVERRSADHTHRNALVSMFLRKLEYHEGILFLTTNRVQTFDEAIVSIVHLAIKYSSLNENARKKVWRSFLAEANTEKGPVVYRPMDLDCLVGIKLNGREIKNIVSVAQAFTEYEKTQVRMSHLESAVEANREFQSDFRGVGQMEAMGHYT